MLRRSSSSTESWELPRDDQRPLLGNGKWALGQLAAPVLNGCFSLKTPRIRGRSSSMASCAGWRESPVSLEGRQTASEGTPERPRGFRIAASCRVGRIKDGHR